MAKGRKTGGKDFAVGNCANPLGQGAVTPMTRAIRKLTAEHIEEVAEVILNADLERLKEIRTNPETTVLKVWIASAALTGIMDGDLSPLDSILNRVMGKPKERHELTGKDGAPLGHLSDEEVERRYQELIAKGKA